MVNNNALADRVLSGDVRSTAQLIRKIDDGDREVLPTLAQLYRHTGNAYIIGFTGSPGVGKSTLVDRIITKFRENEKTVGVLAVDPTSPFSGGAILGDRIRMQRHFMDEGVFIRSLATRGKFGGLTRSTADAIVTLDAMGKDVIIVETVGVGQDEVDIVNNAHTTVVVTVPGMGDDIQAIKAGLMEIGDLFVVNKADREGVGKTVKEIMFMLHMSDERRRTDEWEPRVVECVASQSRGVEDVYAAILEHRSYLKDSGKNRFRTIEYSRILTQLMDLFRDGLMERALQMIGGEKAINEIAEEIMLRRNDPYQASSVLLDAVLSVTTPGQKN